MTKSPIIPGIILVILVAFSVTTLFPSKLKICIDENIKILNDINNNSEKKYLIEEKGKEISIRCKEDSNFKISKD